MLIFFLALVGVLAYAVAFLVFIVAPSAIQEIFAGLAVTCGTIALGAAGIIERLDQVIKRLAASDDPKPKKDEVTEQPWA